MPNYVSLFSNTRGPIDNLTSVNATYEYRVETRIGEKSINESPPAVH